MSKKTILISFTPAVFRNSTDSYVEYYALNPVNNVLTRKRIKVNHIKCEKERKKFVKHLIHTINSKLYQGWNPFMEEKIPMGMSLFSIACEKFLNQKEKELKDNSIRSYESFTKTFQEWILKTKGQDINTASFSKLDALQLMNYVYDERKVSNTTYNSYKTFFNAFFNWLVEQRYVAENHFNGMRKKKEEVKERTILSKIEREKVEQWCKLKDPSFFIVTKLVYHTLLRPNEIRYLKPKDFSLKNQTIFLSGKYTKNGNDRVATIPNDFLLDLAKWNFNNAKTDEYIFATDLRAGDTPVDPRRFSKIWDRLRTELKLPISKKLYSLRDTGIIEMLNAGISIEEVRKQADHSSLEITTIYTKHANPNGSEQIKTKSTNF